MSFAKIIAANAALGVGVIIGARFNSALPAIAGFVVCCLVCASDDWR